MTPVEIKRRLLLCGMSYSTTIMTGCRHISADLLPYLVQYSDYLAVIYEHGIIRIITTSPDSDVHDKAIYINVPTDQFMQWNRSFPLLNYIDSDEHIQREICGVLAFTMFIRYMTSVLESKPITFWNRDSGKCLSVNLKNVVSIRGMKTNKSSDIEDVLDIHFIQNKRHINAVIALTEEYEINLIKHVVQLYIDKTDSSSKNLFRKMFT